MTRAEFEFFEVLLSIAKNDYHVFPQVHFDAILNHKVVGQNWFGAFRHINEKSVDFLICDKSNARPLLAIELDDKSHKRSDRHERDIEVERIFKDAGLPLFRLESPGRFAPGELAQKISMLLLQ